METAVRPSCSIQSVAPGLTNRSDAFIADQRKKSGSRSVGSYEGHRGFGGNKNYGCAQVTGSNHRRFSSLDVFGTAGSQLGVASSSGTCVVKLPTYRQWIKDSTFAQDGLPNRRRVSVRARGTESNLTVERPGVQKQQGQRQLRPTKTVEKKKEIYKGLEDSPCKVERCVIVDEDNNVVGEASRADTVGNRLWGRGVYCLVQNARGQLLVTQRTEEKDLYPGHLDVVCSGCVNVGEEYSDTIERELSEELGLKSVDRSSLAPLFLFKWVDEYCRIWGCGYHYVTDCETFDLQVEEVQWCKWMDLDDVEELIQTARFTPVGLFVLRRFLQERQATRASTATILDAE